MTEDIFVVLDRVNSLNGWEPDATMLLGRSHGMKSAPYANVALGLREAVRRSQADYVVYLEPDVLVGSRAYLEHLDGSWCVGSDYRIGTVFLPHYANLMGCDYEYSHYLLGCCVFYHRNFLLELDRRGIFDKLIDYSWMYDGKFAPSYLGYDLSEHYYPTMAKSLGGKVREFSHYRASFDLWGGDKRFQLRWKPDIESWQDACLMHPVKSVEHPARIFHKRKRLWNR